MRLNPVPMGLACILILVAVGSSGCDTPTPISAMPRIVYYHEADETRIFVTGDLYMYEGINITIENDTRSQNFTYGMTHSTNLSQFNLDIHISDNTGDKEKPEYTYYLYSANVTVEIEREDGEEVVTFVITDIHQDREIERESPYDTLMEKVK